MFMDVGMMQSIKKAQAEGRAPDQAFLVSPGTLATVAGGHGTQFGLAIPVIASPADAPAFVEQRVAEGSDFIKIIHDDGSAYKMPWKTLTDAEVAALIDAAHKRGKIAVIHAATLKNCVDALNAGVDGLAHLYFNDAFDPDFGKARRERKRLSSSRRSASSGRCPGPSTPRACPGTRTSRPISSRPTCKAMKTGDVVHHRQIRLRRGRTGLWASSRRPAFPILAGTDAPNPSTIFGASLHRELVLLVAAGLTPVEALRAATSVPAETFGLRKRGRVKPGFVADLCS